MSEYQYYEFKAIDTPLSETQQAEVAELSSRSQITPTSAKFVYNYGSFRGNASHVINQYFDAMIYMANWGTKRLMFRIPAALINLKQFSHYCQSEEISIEKINKKRIIIDFNFHEEEGYGWLEGEGWLDSLSALREELIQGDLRVLYLAWLKTIQNPAYGMAIDENTLEPMVPPGLGNLSSALKNFVEFYDIDQTLITVAAKNSDKQTLRDTPLFRWITKLPVKEQQDYLKRLSQGEQNLSTLLNRRLLELANAEHPITKTSQPCRKISELFEAVEKWRQQQDTAAKYKAKQKRQQALKSIAKNQLQLWQQVDELIEYKTTNAYDEAITLLNDLRDLAELEKTFDSFNQHIDKIRRTYSRRSGLIARSRAAKLLTD